jgi:hypothetical protein
LRTKKINKNQKRKKEKQKEKRKEKRRKKAKKRRNLKEWIEMIWRKEQGNKKKRRLKIVGKEEEEKEWWRNNPYAVLLLEVDKRYIHQYIPNRETKTQKQDKTQTKKGKMERSKERAS